MGRGGDGGELVGAEYRGHAQVVPEEVVIAAVRFSVPGAEHRHQEGLEILGGGLKTKLAHSLSHGLSEGWESHVPTSVPADEVEEEGPARGEVGEVGGQLLSSSALKGFPRVSVESTA